MNPRSSSSAFGHLWRWTTARDAWPRPRGSGSSAMTSTPCAARERATARPVMWQLKTRARGSGLDAVKGEVDIGQDVARILDADGHPQESVGDTEASSFLGRKPAVRGDRRVQHLGEEIADRRGGGGELECVEESEGRGLRVVA